MDKYLFSDTIACGGQHVPNFVWDTRRDMLRALYVSFGPMIPFHDQ